MKTARPCANSTRTTGNAGTNQHPVLPHGRGSSWPNAITLNGTSASQCKTRHTLHVNTSFCLAEPNTTKQEAKRSRRNQQHLTPAFNIRSIRTTLHLTIMFDKLFIYRQPRRTPPPLPKTRKPSNTRHLKSGNNNATPNLRDTQVPKQQQKLAKLIWLSSRSRLHKLQTSAPVRNNRDIQQYDSVRPTSSGTRPS